MVESKREAFLRRYAEAKLRQVATWHEQGMLYARAGSDSRYDELIIEAEDLRKQIVQFETVLRREFANAPQVGMIGVTVAGSASGREGWTRCVVGLVRNQVVMRTVVPFMLLPDDFLDCEEVDEPTCVGQAVS